MFDKIILGCGYLGRRVAAAYQQQGQSVAGLVRSEVNRTVLLQQGVQLLNGDLDEPMAGGVSIEGDELFYFAPPPREGEQDLRVRNLVKALLKQGRPKRLVYLSTTGVYGDCAGEWTDENRTPNPVVARAKRRWDAEQSFRQWREASGGELIILRVAGIYGPGKLPLARLSEGLPMICEDEAPYTNRIHVDDLVQVCLAAMEKGRDGEVYNISDGHPGNMTDYFNRIADLFDLPRPEQISMSEGAEKLSKGMMSYMAESRRLDNRKMLKELGVKLKYPDLDSGLDTCL